MRRPRTPKSHRHRRNLAGGSLTVPNGATRTGSAATATVRQHHRPFSTFEPKFQSFGVPGHLPFTEHQQALLPLSLSPLRHTQTETSSRLKVAPFATARLVWLAAGHRGFAGPLQRFPRTRTVNSGVELRST
jgi:hypothetical protein